MRRIASLGDDGDTALRVLGQDRQRAGTTAFHVGVIAFLGVVGRQLGDPNRTSGHRRRSGDGKDLDPVPVFAGFGEPCKFEQRGVNTMAQPQLGCARIVSE